MQKDIRRRHEANRRAQAICEQNRGVIETNDGGKKALARFAATVDGVDVLLADQEQARNDRQKARADLEVQRRTLRDILKAVVDVSPFVMLGDGSAGTLLLPEITTDEQLTAVANAIDRAATANAAAFVAEGLPANVIPNLQVQIDRFVQLRKTASTARRAFAAAGRAARTLTKSGRKALKVMDAILAQAPNADPKQLEQLRAAKRIGYDHPTVPTAAPATPAAPAAMPTPPAEPTETTLIKAS